jgi:hypothetical protein
MRTFWKYVADVALAGGLALVAATPSQARWHGGWHGHGWHHGPAAAIGFGPGALLGAVAASPYYYAPAYYPGYAYAPDPYAYDPGPVYAAPAPAPGGCWHATDETRGYGYYGACY